MKKLGFVKALPILLAGCVGASGSVWAPVACSCSPAWQDIASGIDRFDLTDSEQLTAAVVANGLKTRFSGKPVTAQSMSFATAQPGCVDQPGAVQCTWWLWESGGKRKGYDVLINTDSHGVFARATVKTVVSGK